MTVSHRRKKRLRNPKFGTESLHGLSWTRVVGGDFPHNRITICCNAKARPDEMVITVPVKGKNETIGTAVLHAACLRVLLEEVPEDISVIRQRAREIRARFVEIGHHV